MAYDTHLAERIEQVLQQQKIAFEAKKMMGGLCFMVDDKMCIGVVKTDLMARVGEKALLENDSRKGVRPMDFTGRPLKGYAFVSPEGIDLEDDLAFWIDMCLQFNPEAKSSKKRK